MDPDRRREEEPENGKVARVPWASDRQERTGHADDLNPLIPPGTKARRVFRLKIRGGENNRQQADQKRQRVALCPEGQSGADAGQQGVPPRLAVQPAPAAEGGQAEEEGCRYVRITRGGPAAEHGGEQDHSRRQQSDAGRARFPAERRGGADGAEGHQGRHEPCPVFVQAAGGPVRVRVGQGQEHRVALIQVPDRQGAGLKDPLGQGSIDRQGVRVAERPVDCVEDDTGSNQADDAGQRKEGWIRAEGAPVGDRRPAISAPLPSAEPQTDPAGGGT